MLISKKAKIIIILFVAFWIYLFASNISNAAYTSYDVNGINESKYPGYKTLLQQIQAQYPNWKIKLLYTGLDWDYVIENERTGHGTSPKSLIYDTYDEAWRCHEPGCYGVKYDVSKRWYCASKEAIEYMMDPRNSLDASYIFQFQDLSSSVGDRSAIEKMVQGTFLNKASYIDAIMEAAQTEGISPFHIVARIKLEQGTDGSGAMNGYTYTTESGQVVTVYNLYNINVSGNDTEAGLLAGAKYAYEQGWTSAEASIKGGAKFLKTDYISKGQTTLYFQKYNVVDTNNLFSHQYMQNIRAANDEGNIMYQGYKDAGILNSTFEFTIPVYENMPSVACPRPKYVKVESIQTECEEYTIGIDEPITINYSYLPSNATNTDFTWTSSNPDVLRVYWNQIRGLKEGTAEIIIKTSDGSVEKRVKVHVKPKVTEIVPEYEEYTIGVNEVIDINYTYLPSNAINTDFSWTASDSSILSVYWNKVRGLKPGTAYVIVKTPDGSVEKKIKITVISNTTSDIKVTPKKDTYTIVENEAMDINCTYTPSNLTAEDFTWTASDSSILSVYWNRVRGLKPGTAYIIVKSLDGSYETKIKVVVQEDTTIKVTPKKDTYTIIENEAMDINCTYTPSNLTAEDFTWTASDSSILSVYWNRVRGLKPGTAYIIVKSLDGSYETKIKVVVQEDTTIKVTPKKDTYTIIENEAMDINCTYTPSNLTAEDFTWTASDSSILSVYWNRVRGLKPGTAYIIVKSLDGSYETKIKVVVQEDTTIKVTPKKDTYTIIENEAMDINCTYTPSNLTAEDFTWTASDSSILSVYWNRVRGLKPGTAYIIVKSLDGSYETKIKVVVQEDTTIKVTPKKDTYTIIENEAMDINCTYTPSNLTAEDFTWTASDSSILSVYWNRVRGLKPGTAYIIVKSLDGSYETKIKVVVQKNTKTTIQKQQVYSIPEENTNTKKEIVNTTTNKNTLNESINETKESESIKNETNTSVENKSIEE